MTANNAITVYEHPLSPYAQKTKLALLEKDIAFTSIHMAEMGDADLQIELGVQQLVLMDLPQVQGFRKFFAQ